MLGMVKEIVKTERWNSFDQFHKTSKTLLRAYKAAGVTSEVFSVPTGGPAANGRWFIQEAADIYSATVDIIHPVKRRIVDYRMNPWQVAQWSAATPKGGLRANLIIIDEIERLKKIRPVVIKGKLVLTRLPLNQIAGILNDRGVAGVISDRAVKDAPEATMWAKFGWGSIISITLQIHVPLKCLFPIFMPAIPFFKI